MTRLIVNPQHLNRDEFLTPFDKIFDQMMSKQFPAFQEEVGVSFNKGAYPKVNIYEYDDNIGIIAEIPGLDKKNVSVVVASKVPYYCIFFLILLYHQKLLQPEPIPFHEQYT